ncbi:GtrA family protein [Pedobacter heparinus]|uniref:GtrA family protein n=1 Tax=Pedobacter heparinus (strain ATCC 13125 / DSM 2366 / CIP 104194 / JCM 7457 / NBRC 12017 / NCIMB 9290 / NRRL B-14731 / HIM 762-3) TaxID=485917 RepID=C6XTQ0_PEDHD|nr:GtrA family protein [Pedobacter heparinus]ACU03686.1 GtrA family protein [Pedobacter heparinus DSM 2366]
MLILPKETAMPLLVAIEFNYAFFFKLIKFGLVGFVGLTVDFSITYLCKEKLRIHKYIASSLGFTIATAANYRLNRYWTFASHEAASMTQFGKYFMICLVGLTLSNILIYLLNDKLKWDFYVAKASAIVIVSLWNFFANYLYTFNN